MVFERKEQAFGDCLEMVGREELQPCISIDRSAELTGFLLHYVNSSLAEDPSPCLGANAIFLFTCLVSQENFPAVAAAVKMQQLLPLKVQSCRDLGLQRRGV